MARPAALLLALCLVACAAPGLDTSRVDPALSPGEAAANPEPARGRTVQWGGLLVHTANLAHGTELEVLAYPLGGNGRPRTDRPPLGRILARTPGYLDPAEFAPGRFVTVVGPVAGTQPGRVGEADYTYPVVEAEQHRLWPREVTDPEPRVRFGIGVIFR